MSELPTRGDGELVVAAVRILEHTEKHPPTETEIAGLLRWHADRARVIANELSDLGALARIKSPFDLRFKLADPARLAELPESEEVGGTIAREMADFDARSREEAERLEKLLGADAPGPRPDQGALDDLARDFGDYRRSARPKNPFGD